MGTFTHHLFPLFAFLTGVKFLTAQGIGWRMIDRFYGFRFEINGTLEEDFDENVRNYAEKKACFGWIQKTPENKRVGEVRCNKDVGPQFQTWLKSQPENEGNISFKVYEDTKIRLHFSKFMILPSSRETCFLDKPHQCSDFAPTYSTDVQFTKEEL